MKRDEEIMYITVTMLVNIYRRSHKCISLKELYFTLKRELKCTVQESLKIVHVLKDYGYVVIENGTCKVTEKGGEAARQIMVHM